MYKKTKLLYSLLGLMALGTQSKANISHSFDDGDDWFGHMRKHMQTMHEHMANSMEQMQKAFDQLANSVPIVSTKSSDKQAITIDADDTHVVVTMAMPNTEPDAMKAERHLDTIAITVAQEDGTTTMRLSEHTLSVERVHETKQDDTRIAHSNAYWQRTLPHAIDMAGDIAIEHTKDDDTLRVKLPRKHPQRRPQQLPIIRK